MKKAFQLSRYLVLASVLFLYACQKSIREEVKADEPPTSAHADYLDPVIEGAKKFFESEVLAGGAPSNESDPRHKLKKVPDWEKAFIAKAPQGDLVIMPLKWEKPLTFTSSFDDKVSLTLAEQTKLFIYKGEDGRYKAEVVTYVPDKEYLETKTVRFSGIVAVEDWFGKAVSQFLFKDGARYKIKSQPKPGVAGRVTEITCRRINWYLCDVAQNGELYNCQYLYTESIGDCDEAGLEPPGSMGSTYEYTEYAIVKPKPWTAYTSPDGYNKLNLVDYLYGTIAPNNGNKFTSIVNQDIGMSNQLGSTHATFATWYLYTGGLTTSVSPNKKTGSTTVKGKIKWNNSTNHPEEEINETHPWNADTDLY